MDAETNIDQRKDDLEYFIDFHFQKFATYLDKQGIPPEEDVRRDFLRSFLSEIFDVEPRE